MLRRGSPQVPTAAVTPHLSRWQAGLDPSARLPTQTKERDSRGGRGQAGHGEAFRGLRWFRISGTAAHPDLGYGGHVEPATPAARTRGVEHLLPTPRSRRAVTDAIP